MSLRDSLLLVLLTGTLAACGGGGGSVADANVGSGSSDTDTDTSTSTGSSGATVSPALGSGTGADFEEGAITLSADYALVGGSVTLTVNGVDENSENEALADSYQYVFSAACDAAVFSISSTYSTSNEVSTVYRNKGCTGGDTVTVTMYDGTSGSLIDSMSTTIETAYPKLGSDTGASFIEGELDGDLELTEESSTDLSVNLVNPLDSNSLVTLTDIIAEWYSDCDDGSFTISRERNSDGTFETQYQADYATCPGDNNITVLVFGASDTSCTTTDTSSCYAVLTETVTVSLGEDPLIGVLDDSVFYSELLVNGMRESEYEDLYGSDYVAADVESEYKLSAGGTMLIKANIVDANDGNAQISGTTYGVTLESSCVEDGTATLDAEEKTTTSGEVRFTYTAAGCLSDEFSANLYTVEDGDLATRINDDAITGVIYIQPAEVGSIGFEGVSELYLSLKNIGDAVLPKQSVVTFTVYDQQGEVVEGQEVDFELTNVTGGITLGSGLTTDTDVTDENGEVTVIVNSGTSHAVTSVRATTQGTDVEISTSSQPITITTGIADQDSFEIVAELFNPQAYDVSGTEVEFTVFASDQYQNPVADGTVVNFNAESGTIESSCETSGGSCSVTWYSSGTRPGNADASLQRVNEYYPVDDPSTTVDETTTSVLGMTTVFAYTIGEGGYTDSNGNGLFDVLSTTGNPEPFVGLAEAFRDDNWSGSMDEYLAAPVEFFADFDNDETFDSTASTTYQGVTCSDSALENGHCATLAHVRSQMRIIQSDSTVVMRLYESDDGVNFVENNGLSLNAGSGTFYVLLQDGNGNYPANGASLAVSGDGYEIFGESGSVSTNTLGYLRDENSNYTGLPTFGELYTVSYEEDDEPVAVEVTATISSSTASVRLTQ